jgi:periplasmic protein CpxP/Spy
MSKLQKIILAAFVSVSVGIPAVSAYANAFEPQCEHGMMHFDQARVAGNIAQRQAQLHDKLGLTADQEAAWSAFASGMTPPATQAKPDWSAISALPAPERMDKMLSMMKEREAAMTLHVAAVKTFYGVLTPAQQKIFDAQFAMRGCHGKHGAGVR